MGLIACSVRKHVRYLALFITLSRSVNIFAHYCEHNLCKINHLIILHKDEISERRVAMFHELDVSYSLGELKNCRD